MWAIVNWHEVDGYLMTNAAQIHLEDLPISRALNVLETLIKQNKDEKERKRIDSRLQKQAEDSWRIDRDGKEAEPIPDPGASRLMSMFGMHGGGGALEGIGPTLTPGLGAQPE